VAFGDNKSLSDGRNMGESADVCQGENVAQDVEDWGIALDESDLAGMWCAMLTTKPLIENRKLGKGTAHDLSGHLCLCDRFPRGRVVGSHPCADYNFNGVVDEGNCGFKYSPNQ
jgi:hypothetical protein